MLEHLLQVITYSTAVVTSRVKPMQGALCGTRLSPHVGVRLLLGVYRIQIFKSDRSQIWPIYKVKSKKIIIILAV